MREIIADISDPFRNGLRPEDNFLNQEGFLEECLNVVPTAGGLEDIFESTDPFSGGQTINFPFPQVNRGRDLTLMFEATTVSEIDTSVVPWTKSTITTKDPSDSSSNKSITKDGIWHIIDLGPTFYAFNGTTTVFRPGLDLLTGGTTTTYATDSVTIKTGCEHKGRVFIGGFDKSNIWDSDWQEIFDIWKADAELQEIDLDKDGPGANWVMWSTIGGGDFPLWLVWPKGFSDVGLGISTDDVIARIERNEFGWAPLEIPGNVTVMKPLGDNVIVYGDEGIQALILAGGQVGFRTIAKFGVMGRGAVTGDLENHVFLDAEGNTWSLGQDLSLERLGYKEWFNGFSASSTVVSSDPLNQEFYFCDPDEAFVLNSQGLAEHDTKITSAVRKNDTLYAIGTSAVSTDIRVKTGALDLNRQALKMIHNIQLNYSGISNISVELQYRNEHTGDFTDFGPVTVNPEGVAFVLLSAREFKIRVTGEPLTTPRLDGLEIRWNLVDKRAVRIRR